MWFAVNAKPGCEREVCGFLRKALASARAAECVVRASAGAADGAAECAVRAGAIASSGADAADAAADVAEERDFQVFVPLAEVRDGAAEPLVPGCVLLCAPSARDARGVLRRARVPEAMLATNATTLVELSAGEADVLLAFSGEGRVAAFTEATALSGGGFRAASGALVGRERAVSRKSSRKKRAWLPVTLGGRTTEACLGLRITRKGAPADA
ncbi:MAG: hypothetical protein Q4C41_07600 [Eggerthellaceae bacterium]|nr:hypothetical protein [Eggerthellaceae bacterium]